MRMNYQFNVVRANNGYCVNARDQDNYNQDTFVFMDWAAVLKWLSDNENYEIKDEEQVRSGDSEAATSLTS
jgi:hypothetical protein